MMSLENNSMVVHLHHEDLKFCVRILNGKEKHTVWFKVTCIQKNITGHILWELYLYCQNKDLRNVHCIFKINARGVTSKLTSSTLGMYTKKGLEA